MGGVWTDAMGRSSLAGLWAAGEVASTGVHGANRLASNSLLEAVVFGARVAQDIAATHLPAIDATSTGDSHDAPPRDGEGAIIEELRDAMAAHVGVIRDGAGLARALTTILRLSSRAQDMETHNMLTAALLIASAAHARRESRGAHFRSDFPRAEAALAHRSRLTFAQAHDIAQQATTP